MDKTSNLKMPFIMAAQAQKHVTHNEALRTLDAVVQLTVLDRDLTAPPVSPVDGDRYIIAAAATGIWLGFESKIAVYQDNAWAYHLPLEGWLCWVADEDKLLVFDGAGWIEVSAVSGGGAGSINPAPLVGVNTTADTTNRLAVSSGNTLLSHEGSDHRVKVNKNSAADTASLLFQDGFSGRAEIGLAGDDDFHFKVSADGTSWSEALVLDATSGRASFPNTRIMTDFSANLLQDSGRFHAGITDTTASAFAKPAYLTLGNGSSFIEHGKFIHNNNDYGGTAGTLNPDVKDLIDKIRHANYRQYGLEFYVGRLTIGSGQAGALAINGTNYYESLYSRQMPRYAAATFHLYLRAKTGNVAVRVSGGQTIYLDGVRQASHGVLTPADGWKSVRIIDMVDPFKAYGYTPAHLDIYQDTSGGQALLACPALLPGITEIDINAGVFASYNIWSA